MPASSESANVQRPDVTFVAPYPPPGELHGGHSGVASYTANLARALGDQGATVEVVAPALDGAPGEAPGEVSDGPVRIRRPYALGASALPAAAAAALERGPRVVHLQWELFLYGGPAAIPGLFPALVKLGRSAHQLVTTMHQVLDPAGIDRRTTSLHRVPVPPLLARCGIGAVQRTIDRASDVTVVHEHSFRRIVPGATVIPHGIESVALVDRQVARRRLGLDDRLVALCFGYLAPYKGLELVGEAARNAGRGVKVVVAGGAHPRMTGRDPYGSDLRARYGDVVDFRGWVPDDAVSIWFSAADLALFPYPKPFSASGALALALAHGTPVLLSPAMARCIGAPSPLVAPMVPDELAGKLDALAASRSQLDDLRAASSSLSEDRWWTSVANRHAQMYCGVGEGVCDGSSPARRPCRVG